MNGQIDWQLDDRTTIRRATRGDFEAVLAVVHDSTRRVQEMAVVQVDGAPKGVRNFQKRVRP